MSAWEPEDDELCRRIAVPGDEPARREEDLIHMRHPIGRKSMKEIEARLNAVRSPFRTAEARGMRP